MKSWLPGEPAAITRAPRACASWIAHVADAAGPAGDEQVLAAAQPEPLEALVRGQRRQRQRRRLLEGQPLGHVGEEALGHGRELGVGAVLELLAAAVAVDRVAGLEPGHRRPDLLDHARRVPAEDHREVVRERAGEVALADLVVDRVQRRGAHPHSTPSGATGGGSTSTSSSASRPPQP